MDISTKASEEIPGRKPGSECPACKNGKLLPVIRVEGGDNGIMGPSGRDWCYHYIIQLACSECSTCFAVTKKHRTLALERHLGNQLKGFKNPRRKPKTCRNCRRTLVESVIYASNVERIHLTKGDTMFLYCDVCFTVHWTESIEPQDP